MFRTLAGVLAVLAGAFVGQAVGLAFAGADADGFQRLGAGIGGLFWGALAGLLVAFWLAFGAVPSRTRWQWAILLGCVLLIVMGLGVGELLD